MRRGVLINRSHHQLALVNYILGRQPLVARLVRHSQLPRALGLSGLPGLPVSQAHPVSPAFAGPIPALPIFGRDFQAALTIQPEDAGDAHIVAQSLSTQAYEESIPVQPSPEMVVQQDIPMQQEQPALYQDSVRLNVEVDTPSLPPSTRLVERADQLFPVEQRVVDQPSLPEQQAAASVEVTVPPLEPVKVVPEDEAVPAGNVVAEDIPGGVERDSIPEIVVASKGTSNVEATETLAAQVEREAEPEFETPTGRKDIREIEVEAEPESFTGQQEDAQPPASQSTTEVDAVQPLPEDGHKSTGEAVHSRHYDDAVRQVERLPTDEAVPPRAGDDAKSPIETVRPRRPRRSIEELTVQKGYRSPSATPSKKEPQEPWRNVQAAKTERRPGTQPTGEDEIHADKLFAPTNTDRSPQAWLARLMGKSVPVQEEVASDAGMSEGLPVASEGSEAPTGEKFSLPLPQQRGEQRQEVKESLIHPAQSGYRATLQQSGEQGPVMKGQSREQGEDQAQAQTVSVTRFDSAESIAPVRKARVQSQPQAVRRQSQQQQAEARQLRKQGQKQVERADALRAVPGEPGKPGMVEAATTQARQSEQLSSGTRRFLRPLLGIDPASVQIHRDAQAAQLADAYHADALTVGDAVELPASNASETPETLGLLAHELMHVARQREQGFVPPILQAQQDVEDGSGAYRVGPSLAGGPGAAMDEEALALQVERQVRQVAREQVRQRGTIIPPAQDTVSLSPTRPFAPNEPVETRPAAHDPWGGLPAPWEPLPGWLTTPVHPTPMEQSVASFPASVPALLPALTASLAQPVASNGSHQQANGSTETLAQRAEIGRSIGEDAIPPASSVREVRAPEPDLDELARQVYSILRNRLEVERRRHR